MLSEISVNIHLFKYIVFKICFINFEFICVILVFLDKQPFVKDEHKFERVSVVIIFFQFFYQLYFEIPGKNPIDANFLN